MYSQQELISKLVAKGVLFYTATLVNCVAINLVDRELIAIPMQSLDSCFCRKFNRDRNRETNLDHVFSFCSKPANVNSQLVYHCPYGLTNIISPVSVSGVVVAGLLAGPIRNRSPRMILDSLDVKQGEHGEPYLEELQQYKHHDINQIVAMSELLTSIIAPLQEEYAQAELAGESCLKQGYSSVIRGVLDYMDRHYHEKITLSDAAKAVYVNPSYLSRIFNREVRTSFNAYLNKCRIEKSKELLADRNINIVEVCLLVGFENQSYYNKVFKKLEGKTPSEYRKELTGAGSR